MNYAKKERIGNPELFIGRKEDMAFFLNWINNIKKEMSRSTAILARRKIGKTAILERLYNITFDKNDGVIPFYYEIKEGQMYLVDFCIEFFMTFIYQYIAFKTRKTSYLSASWGTSFAKAKQVVESEGLGYLGNLIDSVDYAVTHDQIDILWNLVRDAPKSVASDQNEFIVQMIDEFQFMNTMIFREKNRPKQSIIDTLAGAYLSTAESKIAPLLVSGSWIGWLMDILRTQLPSRFTHYFLESMPKDEALEMVFKYSSFFDVPVTEETAFLIAEMTEGSPFYIMAIFNSNYRRKDLTTIQGLTETLDFEIRDNRGIIKPTWMEYVLTAFNKVNEKNAKNIVLYLCKHRDREITRKELLEKLSLDMTDSELEQKLRALIMADIISQGQTNYDYQGVRDNIFDKVFRSVYEKEIQDFDVKTIGKEIHAAFETLQKEYHQLQGKFNQQKGYYAEYVILKLLISQARKKNDLLKSVTRNLPPDFNFCDYVRVWSYNGSTEFGKAFNIDIYARAKSPEDYSIIGEVKNRDNKKFSKDEVLGFMEKYAILKKQENLERVIPFIFSNPGFTQEATDYCQEIGIAYSEDESWLDN